METIDLGKVAYTHKGEYQAETQYEKFDVVSYQGSSYVCAVESLAAGTAPTGDGDANWKLLSKKGDKGDTGSPGFSDDAASDGKMYGRKDGQWADISEKALVLTNVSTVESLASLPVENYSIKVTLTASEETGAMSFASDPAEGMEYMIDVLNNAGTDITVKLPNNGDKWQCDVEQISITTKKIASISVRYVHGKYVVLTRSF